MQFDIPAYKASLRLYLGALLKHFWVLVLLFFLEGLGFLQAWFANMTVSHEVFIDILIACVLLAQFMAWHEIRVKKEELEKELASLSQSYGYSLSLEAVTPEDRRGTNEETGEIIERHIRYKIDFKNTLNKPISYKITKLEINGIDQRNISTRGSGIGATATAVFYTPTLPVNKTPDAVEKI